MNKFDIARTFVNMGKSPPPIVYYSELESLHPCIFLYTGEEFGHWCAILRDADGDWEIFDPMGLYPDSELDHPGILHVGKKLQAFCEPEVRRGFKIYYNHFDFQKRGSDCGLWCILRWLEQDLDAKQFIDRFEDWEDVDICRYFNRMDLLEN
jgi:hypothetical protein